MSEREESPQEEYDLEEVAQAQTNGGGGEYGVVPSDINDGDLQDGEGDESDDYGEIDEGVVDDEEERQFVGDEEDDDEEGVEEEEEYQPAGQQKSLTSLLLGDPNAAEDGEGDDDEDEEDEDEDDEYIETAPVAPTLSNKKRSIDELDGEDASQGSKKIKA